MMHALRRTRPEAGGLRPQQTAPAERRSGLAPRNAVTRVAAVATLALVLLALTATMFLRDASAQVPEGDETEGASNTYILTDSWRTPSLLEIQNSPDYQPSSDLGLTDDDSRTALPLPFDFEFYGTTYPATSTNLYVSTNGLIAIGTDPGIAFSNQDFAARPAGSPPIIAPFWDDLHPRLQTDPLGFGCNGRAFSEVFTTATSERVLVIEWRNMCDFANAEDSNGYTFQVRLFENANTIEFHYEEVTGSPFASATDGTSDDATNLGGSATIGISSSTTQWLQYSHRQPNDDAAGNQNPPFPPPNAPPANNDIVIRFTPCSATTNVDTPAELDGAIACYNAQTPAGSHTINITGDIAHTSAPPQINGPDTLYIYGQNNALSGPWTLGSPAVDGRDLLTFGGTGTTFVRELTVADPENHAIHVESGSLVLGQSTIVSNVNHGIRVTNGFADLYSVSIHAEKDAIHLEQGGASVYNSYLWSRRGVGFWGGGDQGDTWATIEQSQISAGAGVESYGARIAILNSTIDGEGSSDAGVHSVTGGDIRVTASTITGFDEGLKAGSSALHVSSSIITDECAGWTDRGTFTVESSYVRDASCGPDAQILIPADSLGVLAAINGCQLTLQDGRCVATRDLDPASNAIGGGDCTDVFVQAFIGGFETGNVELDQRNESRDAGSCDAGAFESATAVGECGSNSFSDVPAGSFYDTPTIWAACNGITTGTSAGVFSPAATVTRAQLATFLWRWLGEPQPAAPNPFSDVPDGAYYETAVTWLAETGVTTGTTATTFSPDQRLSRAQAVTLLYRAQWLGALG